MPSDESKGSQLDAIGSLAQRQLDNTLFGLIASGQIQLRRIDGYQGLSEVLKHAEVAA